MCNIEMEYKLVMVKTVVRWVMNIVFYVIYFLIYDYTVGSSLSVTQASNIISMFILIVINIPLSVFSTEKVFSIIEKKQ